jgi:hypothetical protein
MRPTLRACIALTVLSVLSVLSVAAGCSSGTAATAATAATPAYQRPGPYPAGVATIDLGSAGPALGERLATGYYPADPARVAGHPPFSYTESETLPASLQGLLPPNYDTRVTLDATVGPPASPRGPFPVVLFSHGYSGERLQYSHLVDGIASWGTWW